MRTFFSSDHLTYDGQQLSSHFAYKNFGVLGNSCVAFVGACDVKIENMLDLEDVRAKKPIYSPWMLHFILEHYDWTLREAIAFQRLMISNVQAALQIRGLNHWLRRGDDLFWSDNTKEDFQELKLSVSIAAPAFNSQLIHLGLNIQTQGTPVPTVGLEKWKIPIRPFAKDCLHRFQSEEEGMIRANCKVDQAGCAKS